jgi:hypothetical protein
MPDTAGEAFYQAALEAYLGVAAGLAGLILDPAAGLALPGALGVAGGLVGGLKGLAGLLVRPMMGTLDAGSKGLRGMGLLCLGRRGVQGRSVRRVRAPGTVDAGGGGCGSFAGAGSSGQYAGRPGSGLDGSGAAADLHAALVASWTARLPALADELAGEQVLEVLATRSCRLLLLTSGHVAYLRASLPAPGASGVAYSLRWLLPCRRVDHVRGAEEALRVVLEFHAVLRLPPPPGAWWRTKRRTLDAANGHASPGVGTQQQQQQQRVGSGGGVGVGGGGGSGGADTRVLLRLPLHRSLRCASPELYTRAIRAISRHLSHATAAAVARAAAETAAAIPDGTIAAVWTGLVPGAAACYGGGERREDGREVGGVGSSGGITAGRGSITTTTTSRRMPGARYPELHRVN